jgi:hypothetical protein
VEYKEADSTGVQVPKIDLGAWQYWGVEPLCRGGSRLNLCHRYLSLLTSPVLLPLDPLGYTVHRGRLMRGGGTPNA